MTNDPIFTIGHSNHSLEGFLALLSKHGITALADVRSAPWSRIHPHFNRDALAAALEARRIRYVYLGRALGGRPADPALYDDGGHVRYERIARTRGFRDGVARVVGGAAAYRIALMCAEKEPLECHRTHLVARALHAEGVEVAHVLADGGLERHARTMNRLTAEAGREPDGDLFPDELIEETTKERSGRIAFAGRNHVSAAPSCQVFPARRAGCYDEGRAEIHAAGRANETGSEHE